MNRLMILFSICLLALNLKAAESRNRVEELFIWKISDEMKLALPEEKSLTGILRQLNQKKGKASDLLQDNFRKMSEAKSAKEREKLLQEHRSLLKAYNAISIEEVDQVQKLLGPDRTIRYLVLKNDLTARLKNLLAVPSEKPASSPMPPPQVIEEK